MPQRVLIIIGTKAQLIKMAPVMRSLQQHHIAFTYVYTGQHRITMSALEQQFDLPSPDFTLYQGPEVTRVWQVPTWFVTCLRHAWQLRQQLFGKPGSAYLVVHGDTFSTALGALFGLWFRQPVAHVEAGLRSNHVWQPFPEEVTRRLVSRLSSVHFCPGTWAARNLSHSPGEVVLLPANTLYDTLQLALQHQIQTPSVDASAYAVCSFHRFETLARPSQLRRALRLVFLAARQYRIICILHPATQVRLQQLGWWTWLQKVPNIMWQPRLTYFDFLQLIQGAQFVLTDGGSNQEECAYLGKPCLLLRKFTERPEGLGENVVLSDFSLHKTAEFLQDWPNLSRSPWHLSPSPSVIIARWFQEHLQ